MLNVRSIYLIVQVLIIGLMAVLGPFHLMPNLQQSCALHSLSLEQSTHSLRIRICILFVIYSTKSVSGIIHINIKYL